MSPQLPDHDCENDTCSSSDLSTLHSCYVMHRRSQQEACDRSKEGHRQYTQQKRLERTNR